MNFVMGKVERAVGKNSPAYVFMCNRKIEGLRRDGRIAEADIVRNYVVNMVESVGNKEELVGYLEKGII